MSNGFKGNAPDKQNPALPWVLLGIFIIIVLVVVGVVRLTSMLPPAPTSTPTPAAENYTFNTTIPDEYHAPSFILPDAEKAGWVGQLNPTSEKAKYVGKNNHCSFEALPMVLKPSELQSKTNDETNSYFLLANSLGLSTDEVKAETKDTSVKIRTGGSVSFKMTGVEDGEQYRMLVTRVFSKHQQASFFWMECGSEAEASQTWDELQNKLLLEF